MRLGYKAYDRSGRLARGFVDASDASEALEQLRKQGLFVEQIFAANAELDAQSGGAARPKLGLKSNTRLERVSYMMRQLALLISTGTPVVDALLSIERQTPQGEWRDVVAGVRSQVESGRPLGEAMAQYPRYFDAVCRSLVTAGETGGCLDAMLERLSHLTRQQVRIRKSVTSALIYPSLLICVAIGVITVMVGFVLPRFEGLFATLGSSLPPLTDALMQASKLLRSNWYIALGGLAMIASVIALYIRSENGRVSLDKALVTLPHLGKVTRAFATARIARVLGVLLEGRVPLLDALALTRHAMSNSLYAHLVSRAEDAVIRGEMLSTALADQRLISTAVVEALRSGERSGQLATVLTTIAEHMDEDNEVALKTLMGLIEPIILLALGLVVGGVAVAMMLPLFDLAAAGQNVANGGGGA